MTKSPEDWQLVELIMSGTQFGRPTTPKPVAARAKGLME
jgi:hypothetical protein